MLHVGSSTVHIDLPLPAVLEGHISRRVPATTVLDPLAATALALDDGRRTFVVVSVDALEFESGFVAALRDRISSHCGIPPGCVMVCATHTHTAPATIRLGTLEPNPQFLESVTAAAMAASTSALSALEPVHVSVGSVLVEGPGINRRRVVGGHTSMAPNPGGPIDNELTTVGFYRSDRLRAVIASYSTHPTTLGVGISAVSADYPGVLRARVRTAFPEADVVFLTGACGDVRPNITDGDEFREGTPSDIRRIGEALGDGVIRSLSSAVRLTPRTAIGTHIRTVSIPFACRPETVPYRDLLEEHASRLQGFETDQEIAESGGSFAGHIDPRLMEEAFRDWASEMVRRADGRELPQEVEVELQALALGDSIAIIALPLEIFAESGLSLKAASAAKNTIISAYSNGSLGYVPTKSAVDSGGYEVEQAYKLYGLPAPYSRDAAERIVEAGAETILMAVEDPGS